MKIENPIITMRMIYSEEKDSKPSSDAIFVIPHAKNGVQRERER
ncbi:MAG: hypothetical protein ABIB79_01805 [archaeon]